MALLLALFFNFGVKFSTLAVTLNFGSNEWFYHRWTWYCLEIFLSVKCTTFGFFSWKKTWQSDAWWDALLNYEGTYEIDCIFLPNEFWQHSNLKLGAKFEVRNFNLLRLSSSNAQKFGVTWPWPRSLFKKCLWDAVRTVFGNIQIKFEFRWFNRFGAICIHFPLCIDRQTDKHTHRQKEKSDEHIISAVCFHNFVRHLLQKMWARRLNFVPILCRFETQCNKCFLCLDFRVAICGS